MNNYFRNLKTSFRNLFLDLLGLEKPMTTKEWVYYIVTKIDDKVINLYLEGTLDEIEDNFSISTSIMYLEDSLINEIYVRTTKHTSIKERNRICLEVADTYIEKVFNRELKAYLDKKDKKNDRI